MTFQQSIAACLTKYADFHGTASRSEYWWFVLFLTLAGAVAGVLGENYLAIFSIAMLLPLLAAGTRRLRETGRSGWAQLYALIPIAGPIMVAIYLAEPAKADRPEAPAAAPESPEPQSA